MAWHCVSAIVIQLGYSRTGCRELVAQGVAEDRKTLEEIKRLYLKGAVTLRDFRVE